MWGTTGRDNWIKNNLPVSCSPEMKIAFEIAMRQAYDQGYTDATKDARSRQLSEEHERRYGPDI